MHPARGSYSLQVVTRVFELIHVRYLSPWWSMDLDGPGVVGSERVPYGNPLDSQKSQGPTTLLHRIISKRAFRRVVTGYTAFLLQ